MSLKTELKSSQDPQRMSTIQEMISVCISNAACFRERYATYLRMSLVQDLLGQMSRIREKATESEAVVRNITKDIQVLDLAKKNLIESMTVMKRLQMLGTRCSISPSLILSTLYMAVNALTQLEDLMKEKKYSDVAQTLAVRLSFKYHCIPSITENLIGR